MICLQGLAIAVLSAVAMSATLAPSDCKWRECKQSFVWNETACACVCTLRAHPDPEKPEMYQQNVWDHWFDMPCSFGTFFDPETCVCSHNRPKTPNTHLPSLQPSEDPLAPRCLTLVDLQVNGSDVKDLARSYVDAHNVTVEDEAGARDGRAALLGGSLLSLPVFEYNDLTSTAQLQLRLRPAPSQDNVTQYIFSNACPKSEQPSLALTFNPALSQFQATVATKAGSSTARCSGSPDENGWFTLALAVEQSLGRFFINGEKCAEEMQGGGPIQSSPCSLTIGADPLAPASDDQHYFYGMLDSFVVKKHCVTM